MKNLFLDHFDTLISTPEDVEKLHRSILQLAIRGRLVEQDLNDESAHELIKRMKEAKSRKISLVRSSDAPYILPKSWVWVRTGDLFEITGGGTPSTRVPEYWDGDIPWITSADILSPKNIRRRKSITKSGLENSTTHLIPPESVIVVTRVGLGKVALNDFSVCISQDSHALLEEREFVYPDYALYCMLVAAQGFQERSRGTTISGITRKQLEDVPLQLPPYKEQIRIVKKIEELFAQTRRLAEELAHSRTELDRLNESALARLLASETPEEFNERWGFIADHFDLLTSAPEHIAPLRQSILELGVRGKLTRREAGDEPARELLNRLQSNRVANNIEKKNSKNTDLDLDNLPSIPENWLWCRVGDICDCIVPNRDKPESFSGDIPWITLPDFNGSIYISESKSGLGLTKEEANLYNARIVPANSVVMSCIGRFGIIGILTKDAVVNQQLHAFLVEDGLNAEYLAYALKTQVPYMDHLATSTTIKYLNKSNCNSIPIPLPPTAEQERIVKRVEALLGWCDALEAQLRSAEEERGRLVESVLAGVGGGIVG